MSLSNITLVYGDLELIVGEQYIFTDRKKILKYSKDLISNDLIVPSAVILPRNSEEISKILRLCNKNNIFITIRGGGTGVSKGAMAYNGCLLLSLERLNQIVEINPVNRTVIVESGVVTQDLQDELAKFNLCIPQNIGSSKSCFIGGNIAVSSGSPKSLKYGPTKNYILNLEVVLASGQIIWTGKNVTKNATGFNITQLVAGSEGRLGIITKIVLQLVPPQKEILLMASFESISQLFNCVHQVFIKGYSPSSMEFIDHSGHKISSNFLGNLKPNKKFKAILWIELEGNNSVQLNKDIKSISHLMTDASEIYIADEESKIGELWALRKQLGEAVINLSEFKDIDLVVPRSQIYNMYNAIHEITNQFNLKYTAFGHIGNGNFHINILQDENFKFSQWERASEEAISKIFVVAVELGGTISGEHGIGSIHKPHLNLAVSEPLLGLMDAIKAVFDPNNILNPN